MTIFILGIPMPCGGGNTETLDTAIMWKNAGIDVRFLYIEGCNCGNKPAHPGDDNPAVAELAKRGIPVVGGCVTGMHLVSDLRDSIVVAFNNKHAPHLWPELKAMGCRMVYSPCMSWVSRNEFDFTDHPPTAIHYHTDFQFERIHAQWYAWGVREFAHIHGAPATMEFHPRHRRDDAFVVGRLARCARAKWSPRIWEILGAVRDRGVAVSAMVMGWNNMLSQCCGKPPAWATAMPENTITSKLFYRMCHAMICPNWGLAENYPRVGLEAMAAGVPLVVDAMGGWPELCGDAALYAKTPEEYIEHLISLATDDDLRQDMIYRGWLRLSQIANPVVLANEWAQLFARLS